MIRHITQLYNALNQRENQRLSRAAATWPNPYFGIKWLDSFSRDSSFISDNEKIVPFVKDVVNQGIQDLTDDDWVVFTNSDTSFVKETGQLIKQLVDAGPEVPSYYSHRYDLFRVPKKQLDLSQAKGLGQKIHEGADLFLFKVSWWQSVKDKIPDLLMGFEGWDWVFKYYARCPMPTIVYHESHGRPYWQAHRLESKLNLYNRLLCKQWLQEQTNKHIIKTWWPAIKEF